MGRDLLPVIGCLLVVAMAPLSASAQPAGPPDGGRPTRAGAFADRFTAANTTGDGRLTLAQARAAGLSFVVTHFAEIDDAQRGYVTLADIAAYRRAHRRPPPGQAASVPAPAPSAVTPERRASAGRFAARFQKANTTGDGRLTFAQARAGHLPFVATHFAQIDQARRGYVTLDDVAAFRRQQRAQSREQNEMPGSALRPPPKS